jgi:aerobic carbon-monoxide dehydrogenase small subunit
MASSRRTGRWPVIELTLNGAPVKLDAPGHWTLLRALRDLGGATDVKYGCGEGVCGACSVMLDGVAVNSCSVLAAQADGSVVDTAAGLGSHSDELHPLQQQMVDRGAVQCGFCTPGVLIGALDAIRVGAVGSREEIRHSLAGNLCRCTGYQKIIDAVEAYARAEESNR